MQDISSILRTIKDMRSGHKNKKGLGLASWSEK
jgi:hypothetical protein